jgi:hypothetical protein
MKMEKNKKKENKFFYILGTIGLVFMLSFTVVNFFRDSRLLAKPVLSNEASDTKTTSDGYKTIKFKKPASTSKVKSKSVKTPEPTAKPTEKATPVPTGEP